MDTEKSHPELVSVLIHLRPLKTAAAPDWWGKAAHALALDLIHEEGTELAADIHASKEPPPLTVSTLFGDFPDKRVQPGSIYQLRFSALNADVARALKNILYRPVVELDHIRFRVECVAMDPLANATTYAELAAWYLTNKAGEAALPMTLSLESPTCFQHNGQQSTEMLPQQVFGSLLRRWNQYSSVPLPKELNTWAGEALLMREGMLQKQRVFIAGGWYPGVVGQVTYDCASAADAYSLAALQILAEFAAYAGVGAKTAMGLGQAHRVAGAVGAEGDFLAPTS